MHKVNNGPPTSKFRNDGARVAGMERQNGGISFTFFGGIFRYPVQDPVAFFAIRWDFLSTDTVLGNALP